MLNNYDTPTTPLPANFRRITSDAYFTPDDADGKTGDIRLGNITLQSLKHQQAEVEVMRAFKGGLQRADASISEVKPEYDLTLNEYIPQLVAIYLFGSSGADLVQAAATAQTAAFPSVNIARSYRLGMRSVSNVLVDPGSAPKVRDLDYQLDCDKGIITVMDGGGIADGDAMTVTFDCAAATLKTVLPYSRLNRYGFLRLYGEDTQSANPREELFFRCNLYPTDLGDGDPKKYSEAKLKVVVLGRMAAYLR